MTISWCANLCKEMLTLEGFTVDAVLDGQRPWRKWRITYQLILSDMRMPGLNGIELLKELKRPRSRHDGHFHYRPRPH